MATLRKAAKGAVLIIIDAEPWGPDDSKPAEIGLSFVPACHDTGKHPQLRGRRNYGMACDHGRKISIHIQQEFPVLEAASTSTCQYSSISLHPTIMLSTTKRRFPNDAVPLVIALLESSRIGHSQKDGRSSPRGVLNRLAKAASGSIKTEISLPLAALSLPELAICSRNSAAAEALAQSLAADAKPIAIRTLGLGCLASPNLTPAEKTRLVRAFMRFQLTCNLLCPSDEDSLLLDGRGSDDDDGAAESRFLSFSMYSPWVNEHLMCVYVWLQRILYQVKQSVPVHSNSVFFAKLKLKLS